MKNLRDTTGELLDFGFSLSDHFIKGHQIINSDHANRGGLKRKNSEWAKSDEKVRKMLTHSFPHLSTNFKQRHRAGIWLRVIHLYFRMGLSYSTVAKEMRLRKKKVRDLLQSIHRAAEGRPASGKRCSSGDL